MATAADDVMAHVCAGLVDRIEQGAGEWRMPWDMTAGGALIMAPRNAQTGKAYQGGNILALWFAAEDHAWASPWWATYKQWQALGAQVRKGERSTLGVRWQLVEQRGQDDVPEELRKHRMIPLAFRVFSADQVDDLPERFALVAPDAPRVDHERNADADAWFAAVGATWSEGGNRAFYDRGADVIRVPTFEQFRDGAEAFYATLAHEHVHWTGHEARLARTFGQRFGDRAYAAEELVAELGAAFVCARLGLASRSQADHAPYLAHWLEILREDPRHLWTVAGAGGQACEYLHERALFALQEVA